MHPTLCCVCRVVPVVLGAVLAFVLTCAPLAAQDLLLVGGTLVDPRTGSARPADLLIVDGRIVATGATGHIAPDAFVGETVDVSGKWIVPGLRDLHAHSFVDQAPGPVVVRHGTEQVARRVLSAGVVGLLDLFNLEDYVFSLRDEQRQSGEPFGAEIFAAGPCITVPEGHCDEYGIPTRTIETPQDARREIGELVAKGPDVVKLVYAHVPEELEGETWRPARPSMDLATLEAAIAAADEHGIPTVVHVRSWRDLEGAARAGATAVTHISDQPLPEHLPALLAERGTVVIPTLSTLDTSYVTDPAVLDDPLLVSLADPRILAAYRGWDRESSEPMLRSMASSLAARMEALGTLVAAGVPIVAGTDAGNPWTVQGWSLHRELEIYVAAGLTPAQALATATTAAGDFLGRSWGLAPGDAGSVLVLDASPLEAITNTRKIHGVVHRGRWVDAGTRE